MVNDSYDLRASSIELLSDFNHHVSNSLGNVVYALLLGENPDYQSVRENILAFLRTLEDGTRKYIHEDSLDPGVAEKFRREIEDTLVDGVTLDQASDLQERILAARENYAKEIGRPQDTREAVEDMRNKLTLCR